MKALVLLACAAAAVLAASSALGDGGPTAGVAVGGSGVASGGIRYVTFPTRRGTTMVAAVRVHGGRILRFNEIRGLFGVPQVAFDGATGGVSADGRTLVLGSFTTTPMTRFAILRLPGINRRTTVSLRGRWAFDALSPSARTMYLIQLGRNGLTYNVRAYDLARRRLLVQPVVDKSEAGDPMRGFPMARVMGDRGRWAYTLYANGKKPFVHALDTVGRRAICIDLRHAGNRLKLRGSRLIVLSAHRQVAVVDTRRLRVST